MRANLILVVGLVAAPPAAAQVSSNCTAPDVLVVFDVSGSMGSANRSPPSKYDKAVAAISTVTQNTQADVRYGLMVFPPPGPAPVHCGDPNTGFPIQVQLGPNAWQPIFSYISPVLYGSTTANPGFFGGPRADFDTPMYQALRSARDAGALADPTRRQYILLITDGVQDCGNGGDYDAEPDTNPGVAYGQPGYFVPAEYEQNRQDLIAMVDEIWWRGIDTFVVGFGSGVDAVTLDELAYWGGTARAGCTNSGDCYYQADDQASLQTALGEIARLVQVESCDGLDNDCDGTVDEDSDVLCSTACGSGFQSCAGGALEPCDAPVVEAESCDGQDNDCNGIVDDGCGCLDGTTQPCGTDTGDCVPGSQRCVGGQWSACDGVAATSELCDGTHDEDCDGLVDEGCACVNGTNQSCGTSVGICQPGRQSCVAGQWGPCTGGVQPDAESCDSLDNDCDGESDEFCDCEDGETRPCGSSLGTCESGYQLCAEGRWGECDQPVAPAAETCDNADNDCDGEVDDQASCAAGSACRCGSCVSPCSDSSQCTAGTSCVGGYCVGESCPEGFHCDGQLCVPGEPIVNRRPDPRERLGGVADGGCDCRSGGASGVALGLVALLTAMRRRRAGRLP